MNQSQESQKRADESLWVLKAKILWTQGRLESGQRSADFWERKELELRQEYGKDPSYSQCSHLRKVKRCKKESFSDLAYWQAELQKLMEKQAIYILFS